MMTIFLDPNMVPANLRRGYDGKKFKARVCESMTIPITAGLWDDGSRDTYQIIRLEDGALLEPIPPVNGERCEIKVKCEPGIAVIEHSITCGKDMGLTFYVHPDNAAKLLPAPQAELTVFERIVLSATASYKSSYDRYEMARRGCCNETLFPTRDDWALAKQTLINLGLLNKAGAITPAGRNAIPSRY